jgi:hypothetical protein
VPPTEVPQVIAFSYTRPDLTSSLECRPMNWTPVIFGGVVNLHVWSAPVHEPDPLDSQRAFQQLAKLMSFPKLRLDPVYDKIKPPHPDEKPLLPGLSCQEELSLIERLADKPSCGKKSSFRPQPAPLSDSLSVLLY